MKSDTVSRKRKSTTTNDHNAVKGVKAFGVTATAIIFKHGKVLITRRNPKDKVLPGLWTVPGGRMTSDDFVDTPMTTFDAWYGVLEKVVAREVKEETGLSIKNIEYVTNMVAVYHNGLRLIISFMADWAGGEVTLDPDHTEYEWVAPQQAVQYKLIEGIGDEIKKASALRGVRK